MSEAPKSGFNVGTPRFVGDKIEFINFSHPELESLGKEMGDSFRKFLGAAEQTPNFKDHLVEFRKGLSHDQLEVFNASYSAIKNGSQAEITAAENLAKRLGVDAGYLMNRFSNPLASIAPEATHELKQSILKATKIGMDITVEQAKVLKGMDITKIEGYSPHLKAVHERSVEELLHNAEGFEKNHTEILHELEKAAKGPGFFARNFEIFTQEGMVAALNHNIGGEAWRTHKGKAFAKSAVTLGGVAMMADAVFRSETKGAEGQPEKRGAIGRWTEFVLGAGVAAGTALHGRRI